MSRNFLNLDYYNPGIAAISLTGISYYFVSSNEAITVLIPYREFQNVIIASTNLMPKTAEKINR
jgi:hypothetical protein